MERADIGEMSLAVLDDLGAFAEKTVYGTNDVRLVAGDRVR